MRISKVMPAKKWMLVISCIGVLGLVALSGFVLFDATKAQVDITEDGEKQTIQTHADTVAELLNEEEITVGEHDDISPNMDAAIEDGMEINYKTAKQVTVTIDKDEDIYYTTVDTIGDFLDEESIKTGKHDDISVKRNDNIKDNQKINIDRAYQVTISDSGEESMFWTTGATIEQLLQDHDISLNDADKVKPALDKKAKEDKTIKIVRVETDTDRVKESLDFDTVTEEDSSLQQGKEKVVSEGKKGTMVKDYEITMEDGEEVDRELVNKEVKKESENRVVAIGTKEPKPEQEQKSDVVTLSNSKSNTSSEDSSSSSSEEFYMTATGYTAYCNGCSGITATGINLKDNPDAKVVAVDPSVIPLGSKVWVEGYGEAIAGDTGGAIKGNRIDIFVPDKADTHKYNMKEVKVKVLD